MKISGGAMGIDQVPPPTINRDRLIRLSKKKRSKTRSLKKARKLEAQIKEPESS